MDQGSRMASLWSHLHTIRTSTSTSGKTVAMVARDTAEAVGGAAGAVGVATTTGVSTGLYLITATRTRVALPLPWPITHKPVEYLSRSVRPRQRLQVSGPAAAAPTRALSGFGLSTRALSGFGLWAFRPSLRLSSCPGLGSATSHRCERGQHPRPPPALPHPLPQSIRRCNLRAAIVAQMARRGTGDESTRASRWGETVGGERATVWAGPPCEGQTVTLVSMIDATGAPPHRSPRSLSASTTVR